MEKLTINYAGNQYSLDMSKNKPTGFENYIANGLTYAEVEWSPKNTFRGQTASEPGTRSDKGEFVFEEGVVYKGVPYSSCKYNDNFVGVNVLLETFLSALKNPNSKLFTRQFFPASVNFQKTTDTSVVSGKTYYTRTGTSPNYSFEKVTNPTASAISTYYEQIHEGVTYGNTAKVYVPTIQDGKGMSGYNNFASTIIGKHVNCNSYYGTVCTTMAKTMYRMPTYETTYSWLRTPEVSKLFEKVYDSSDVVNRNNFNYADIQSGDIVLGRGESTSHGHVFVIYEKRETVNSAHTALSVRFTAIQSGYPVVEVAEISDDDYPEKLLGCTIVGGVRDYSAGLQVEIYRAKDKSSVEFLSESPLVNIGREVNQSFVFNDLIGLDKGNKSHYRVGQANKSVGIQIASEDIERTVTVTRFDQLKVSGVALYTKFGKKFSGTSEFDFASGSDTLDIDIFSLINGHPMYYGNIKIVPYITENGIKKYYENKYQELFAYDTGDVYDLRITHSGTKYYLNGKTHLESCGLTPQYVSVSSLDGTIKRTAPIVKTYNRTLGFNENTFKIELITEGTDVGTTSGKPWVKAPSDTDNKGSQLLKVHCYHPWGYCVSLPITVSTLPI